MGKQVNWQVSFNLENRSHCELMNWVNSQTTNRSSFIRETLTLRMIGSIGNLVGEVATNNKNINRDEALRIVEV